MQGIKIEKEVTEMEKQDVEILAEKYQIDVEDVLDLIKEGFTITEAEEIISAAEM